MNREDGFDGAKPSHCANGGRRSLDADGRNGRESKTGFDGAKLSSFKRWAVPTLRKINELYENLTRPWAVEFAEIDALPLAENQFHVVHHHQGAVSNERCFDVAIRVAFGVAIVGFIFRNQRLQLLEHVVLHIRIGV